MSNSTGLNALLAAIVLVSAGAGMAPAYAQEPDTPVNTGSEAVESAEPVLDLRPGDAADPCDPDTAQIRTTVNGIEPYGILTVELYGDDSKNFLSKEGRLRRVRVAAEAGPQMVCINVTGAGTYAVASYHDEDGDRKLDRKWTRLPKEPFALSNNPKLKLRKPRLREAAFEAGEDGAYVDLYLRGSRPDR